MVGIPDPIILLNALKVTGLSLKEYKNKNTLYKHKLEE